MTAPARPRVYFDANAGAWVYALPGRRPVQADSWAAAVAAVTPPARRPSPLWVRVLLALGIVE